MSLHYLWLCLCWVWCGLFFNGFNYGIDFAGGNEIQIRFQQVPSVEELRKYLSEKGMTKASVQSFGDEENEFLILTDNEPGEMKKKRYSINGFWWNH